MLMRSRSLLCALLLLLLAMSVSPIVSQAQQDTGSDADAAPPTSTSVDASGWRTYQQSADGYSLKLPPSWRKIDLDPATIQASVDAMRGDDPTTADWLGSQAGSLIASHVSFFGFDFNPAAMQSGFATNANVIHGSLPGPIPLSTVVQISAAQLENLPNLAGDVGHRPVSVAAGQAERFDYHLQVAGRELSVTQFVVARGSDSYVLTLTTTDDLATSYTDAFDQIGKSFTLLG